MISLQRRRLVLVIGSILISASCGNDGGPAAPPQMSSEARAFLEEVTGVMRVNSVRRLEINWTDFTAEVLAVAEGAQSISETYPAIRRALRLLGDNHSSFRTPEGASLHESTRSCTAATVASIPSIPGSIGYLQVRSFAGSAAAVEAYAQALQDSIRKYHDNNLIGWIVDVRGNGGGNMWPMIAGVGPLLGEGVVGHFINPEGVQQTWSYEDGEARLDGATGARAPSTYEVEGGLPRIAVLTDGRVASSGEAVVIAFKARENTRSFGSPTCGLSTANRGFALSHGAALNLTVSTMADRLKREYGDAVSPDEVVAGVEEVVKRAISWLEAEHEI